MTWQAIRELADAGVAFGSHGATHRDLTRLSRLELEAELAASKQAIEDRLAEPATLFAMPYGSTGPAVRRQIERLYSGAVGTRLDRAASGADIFDLPRLDMWYFRDARRWSRFLDGRAEAWFAARRALRRLGQLARGGLVRAAGR
jgi:peptidoglycan/xylan/chitin deacetylase (PgdA/CDA1 family)